LVDNFAVFHYLESSTQFLELPMILCDKNSDKNNNNGKDNGKNRQ